jgi:hypothetical protein
MPFAYRFSLAVTLLGVLLPNADRCVAEEDESVAPGKFIPTFAVKYGSATGWPPVEEAARFDLLDVSSSMAHAKVHASQHGNTWRTLKHLHPQIRVVLYNNGPGLYINTSWGQIGKGWDWLIQTHGIDSPDRWAAVGVTHGGYLQGTPYPGERLMNVGNPNWRRYWAEETCAKFWSGHPSIGEGADGIFADNCGYRMPWRGQWHLEGHPDKPDMPADYTRDGTHQPDSYKTHIKEFYRWVVPWLQERERTLVLNFGGMARQPGDWLELDREPHPVFAAMEEGAFVHPWGTLGRQGNFVFWSEEEWLNQVNTMRKLRHVRALMNVHGPVISDLNDLRRMDAQDASGNRAWDVLWYALTSFLQGYDDLRQNAYMNFTVWGYSRFYWLDEFDSQYLHLGKAVGGMQKVTGTVGHVYLREFEDGWVAVNPTRQDASGVLVPRGKARVLRHDTFKTFDQVPQVEKFDLPGHRGVVLLKPGHHAGNADN